MDRARLALIGCGGFARAHGIRLQDIPDAELVALCDTDLAITASYAADVIPDGQQVAQYDDPAAMLREQRPDGVLVLSPHTLHYQHAMQVIEAGCDVMIEKPMVTDAQQAHRLRDRARELGRTVLIGYNTPCQPTFDCLRRSIREERLGPLHMVSGYLSQDWLPSTRGKWRQDPALSGGGQAYDSGAHLLNSLCWLVESDIDTVFAFVDNHGTPVDINSSIHIKFSNGVMASVVVSGNCPTHGTHMGLVFDDGRVEVDGWSGSWINVFKGKDKVKYPAIVGETGLPDDNFIDAIQGEAEPATSPRNGIIQSELMDAIYESARTGQPAKPKRR